MSHTCRPRPFPSVPNVAMRADLPLPWPAQQATEVPPAATVRIGDTDRTATSNELGLAFTFGYLDLPEYQRRLDAVAEALNGADLAALTADLPLADLARRDPQRLSRRRRAALIGGAAHAALAVLTVVLCWLIWWLVGSNGGTWYPWPLWPLLGTTTGFAAHAIPVLLHSRQPHH
jgi:hypothetical protein